MRSEKECQALPSPPQHFLDSIPGRNYDALIGKKSPGVKSLSQALAGICLPLHSDANTYSVVEGFCMVIQTLALSGMLICAIQAIRAERLLVSALWLAGCSALLALAIGLLGAPEVGVVELSVGAGLVTVIFVFAISIAGEDTSVSGPLVPRPIAWALMGLFTFLLIWLTVPRLLPPVTQRDALPFLRAVWDERSLDTVLQVVLIFSGVLGSLGLLAERREAAGTDARAERHGAGVKQ